MRFIIISHVLRHELIQRNIKKTFHLQNSNKQKHIMESKFDQMMRQQLSNLIGYIFRNEPIQTQKNPMPHAKDLTYQSILSILAEKVEYQFLQYWQLNQSVLLVISIVVLVFILIGIKWFNGSGLRNTWTLINSSISWFNKS